MKFSISRTASFLLLASVFTALQLTGQQAFAQTTSPSPTPTQNRLDSPSATQQQPATQRERRAQAYAKVLEGQRHLATLRRDGNPATLRRAQLAFQEAATLDPTLAEAHTALAEIAFYYSPQDFDTAAQEATSAARIDSGNYGAHHILSRLYTLKSGLREDSLNRQFVDLAIKELKEATRLEAKDAEAWALLGEFYQATGRTAEALDAWTQWAAAPPTTDTRFYQYVTNRELSPDAAVARLGEALFDAGRTTEALAAVRRAIALNPENQEYGELLVRFYLSAARYADAIAVYEEQLKAQGIGSAPLTTDEERTVAAKILERMIEVYKRAGNVRDVAATIARMRHLLGKDDPLPDAQEILYLREQGKRDEALQAVRAARQRFPEQTEFLQLEAEILSELGRVDEAVALVRTQLKGSIEDFNTYLVISGLYLQASRAADAVVAARKALELAPAGKPEMTEAALITLASAQERAGDLHGSEESLRRILAKDPNNATALNNLGYFLVERNERLAEALEMIQRAVRAEPNNSSFLDSLGWAYFKLGKLDEAERNLAAAASRNSSSSTIQEHLGDLYQQRGKMEMARAAWQKALSLAVEAQDTARLKTKLNGKSQK